MKNYENTPYITFMFLLQTSSPNAMRPSYPSLSLPQSPSATTEPRRQMPPQNHTGICFSTNLLHRTRFRQRPISFSTPVSFGHHGTMLAHALMEPHRQTPLVKPRLLFEDCSSLSRGERERKTNFLNHLPLHFLTQILLLAALSPSFSITLLLRKKSRGVEDVEWSFGLRTTKTNVRVKSGFFT
jgi:hypothetical protein